MCRTGHIGLVLVEKSLLESLGVLRSTKTTAYFMEIALYIMQLVMQIQPSRQNVRGSQTSLGITLWGTREPYQLSEQSGCSCQHVALNNSVGQTE